MPFESWILIFIALINLLFVGVLSSRSSKTTANKLFIAAIVFNIFWAFGDALFYASKSLEVAQIGLQFFFIAPLFTAFFLLLFARTFLSEKSMNLLHVLILLVPPSVLTIALLLDNSFLIKEISLEGTNTFLVNQIPFILYTLYFSVYFGLSYIVLYIKSNSKSGVEREQLRYILYAAVMSSFLAMISNLSLPLMGVSNYIWLGPLFTLFYVLIVALSIIRHRLFDIRAAIARSTAYLATVTSIVLVYVLIIYVLSGTNIIAANLSTLQRIVFATIAVVSGFLFQPFKRFFDKFTNKIFYQDAYEAQTLIDELNKTLVSTVDIESLLTKSSLIIQENLKASYVTFYVRETSYFEARNIGTHRKSSEIQSIDEIQELSKHINTKVHYVNQESKNETETKLNKALKKNDFEIVARLVDTLDFAVKGVGLLFLGPKRSGSAYTKQDIRLLEIISNELVIATENILRFEEIEKFNETLQKKIDDATKELKQTNEKLKALDEAKDEFVSMASHQLRTPLTSIKGYISMVLEGDAGAVNDVQKKMLGQAFFSSQRMVYLISDLLNVSRLKTGKFIIETKPIYLPDVVESEINQLIEGAGAKNITLSFTKPKTFATMNLDEMKLRQVIMNFTDNSIYYTPNGGKINVELKETPKSVEFTVKDSGIGVPKEQQQKLFTKFYRADNARKARPDGTGLGLFMAKKVIIAQGGSIIFDSKENKGSTFGFTFPKDRLEVKTDKTDSVDDKAK